MLPVEMNTSSADLRSLLLLHSFNKAENISLYLSTAFLDVGFTTFSLDWAKDAIKAETVAIKRDSSALIHVHVYV